MRTKCTRLFLLCKKLQIYLQLHLGLNLFAPFYENVSRISLACINCCYFTLVLTTMCQILLKLYYCQLLIIKFLHLKDTSMILITQILALLAKNYVEAHAYAANK